MPAGRTGPKFFVPVAAGPLRDDLLREGIELQGRHVVIRDSEVLKLREALGKLPKKLRPSVQPVALGVAGGIVAPPCGVSEPMPVATESPVAHEILCALLQLTRRGL